MVAHAIANQHLRHHLRHQCVQHRDVKHKHVCVAFKLNDYQKIMTTVAISVPLMMFSIGEISC